MAHVNHRADLTYVIGEMISELDAGHAYVGGGDYPKPQRIPTGLLGAELSQDEKTQYYKIDKILKGSTWDAKYRSPLTEIGVNVSEGEYIIAVNGKPTNEMVNIYEVAAQHGRQAGPAQDQQGAGREGEPGDRRRADRR